VGEPGRSNAPEGLSIDSVDWLPSGARSGLVRVRAHWNGVVTGQDLPELVIEHGGREHRHASLPDPRTGEDGIWRGAYVVHADLVAGAPGGFELEFPGGARAALPALTPAPASVADSGAPVEEPEEAGGEVVDRAVMAERRARRAEASEQAQARIAREAMKAVEVLERKLDELVAERDELAGRPSDPQTARAAVDLLPEIEAAHTARDAERAAREKAQAERDVARAAQRSAQAETETARLEDAALRAQLDTATGREAALREEIEDLRALAERLDPSAAVQPAAPARPVDSPPADRQAVRLRQALSGTIVQMAGLREQLREARLHLRTSEVGRGADSVKLLVLEREHAQARAEVREQAGAAELMPVLRAEVDELRSRSADQETRLAESAERARTAEADLERTRAEAIRERDEAAATERGAQADLAALRAKLEQAEGAQRSLRRREQAAAAALDAVQREWTEREDVLGTRIASLETDLDAAEQAREIAEATAAAAESGRRTAEVQRGALAAELAREREARAHREVAVAPVSLAPAVASSASPPSPAPPPADRAALARAAEDLTRPAPVADAVAVPDRSRMLADLDAAQASLQAPAEAFLPPTPPVLQIDSPSGPPRHVATGRSAREYPPLRGALVKLSHDDPSAAARLIVGLLPAQGPVLAEDVDYDLTITGHGTHAVTVSGGITRVEAIARPRPIADFHLQADPVSLAEMACGFGPKPRRFGRVKIGGSKKRLRILEPLRESTLSLEDALQAGAKLDPVLVLRCLAYAVHPLWTAGHDFTIEETLIADDGSTRTIYLSARDGRGLAVTTDAPGEAPKAVVHLTERAFAHLLAGEAPPPGERPSTRGDHRAVEQLRVWADRARASGR